MPTFHVTLAYVKKGAAASYVGDTRFEGREMTFSSLTFSPHTGPRAELPLLLASTGQAIPQEAILNAATAQVYTPFEALHDLMSAASPTLTRHLHLSAGWEERLASLQAAARAADASIPTGGDPLPLG